MKTEYSTQCSAKAAFVSAKKNAKRVMVCLEDLQDGGDPKLTMPLLREYLGELTQRVHEFNAFTNVLKGDDIAPKHS